MLTRSLKTYSGAANQATKAWVGQGFRNDP
jgi:hypothetical protein